MAKDIFTGNAALTPDYSLAGNWSGGTVPGFGTVAVIGSTTVLVDPQTAITARVELQGTATLSGNEGGFAFAPGSAATIQGQNALYADGAIVNAGSIGLAFGTALQIIVENGAAIAQSYGLQLPSFENAGTFAVAESAIASITGTELSNTGTILVNAGEFSVTGGGVDGGQSTTPHGGDIILTNRGFAYFADAVANQNITFKGIGTLALNDPADIANVTISGFAKPDIILANSVTDAQTLLANLSFEDLPAHTAPTIIATAAGAEILLEPAPPCFARGTGLLTPTGYVPVENLKPNDPIVTATGDIRAVRWVGTRTIDLASHTRPHAVQPIRILANAIAPTVPSRTLRLSPDHALWLNGQLVPVKLLVNGATIIRETRSQAVTYLHVELDRHDILVAENLGVESYLDTGNRSMFETATGTPYASPVFGRGRQWDEIAFAPLCLSGEALKAIRRGIRTQALELGYRPRTLTGVTLWAAGRKYLPVAGGAAQPVFHLSPPHPDLVVIRSPRFVPAEMAGGFTETDDYRNLGIAITSIQLGRKTVPLREIAVSGVHPAAPGDAADWTTGNAVIRIPESITTICLNIAALPLGWVAPNGQAVPNF